MNDNDNSTITLLFPLFYLALADLKTLLENIQQQGSVGVEKVLCNSKADVKVTHTHASFKITKKTSNYESSSYE